MFIALLKRLFGSGNQEELTEVLKTSPFLVDVRTPGEFASGSAPGAVNIPLNTIPNNINKFKNKDNIVVFCRSGNRSSQAASILGSQGITNVVNGGTVGTITNLLSKI